MANTLQVPTVGLRHTELESGRAAVYCGLVFDQVYGARRYAVALMKEHQIAAVYNHENPEMLGMASMMGGFPLSSLVDNILLLNWVELGDSFRLGLTVAKMRAHPVDRATHECEITVKGMQVLPRELKGALPHAAFSSYSSLVSRAPERRRSQIKSSQDSADRTVE